MFSFKDNILYFSLFYIFGHVWSLVQLPEVEDNDIAITETIIRDTVNNLFANFKIREVKNKPRLKDFSVLHNFFVSMTLKDCKNLKEIARLTRVNDIDNNTKHLITQINEVLNEGDNEEPDDIYLTTHIEKFIKKLRHLKEVHGLDKNYWNLSINSAIIKHLNNNENILSNFTNEVRSVNNSDDNDLTDSEVWTPLEQSGRRVFGGHRTRIKFFPFIATIQFFEKFQCAGSIVKRDLIITAASCLQLAWNNRFFRENPSFLSVQVGCDYYEAGGENIPVMDVYFHPDYNPKNLNNNLALLRLGTNIVFSKKINNVKRIWFDRVAAPLPSNSDGIFILGWGATDSTNIIYSPWRNRLTLTELDYYPLQECQDVYSKDYVTYKNFCAGFFSKGGGACNHDIGGPGFSGGILLGVISFGPPVCGTPDAPTVFTKLGYYTKWIDSVMRQQVPQIVRLSTIRRSKSTFALHYSDSTRKAFKIKPIRVTGQPHGFIPIPKGISSLRILNDDRLFREFMSTMFESNEGSDYTDLRSREKSDSECDENITKIKDKRKTKVKSSSTHTVYKAKSNDKDIKKGMPKIKRKQKSREPPINHKETNGSLKFENEVKVNDDVKSLLDDLDLYKLLNSEEPADFSDYDYDVAARAVEANESTEINTDTKNVSKQSDETYISNPSDDDDENTGEKEKSKYRLPKELLQSSDKYGTGNEHYRTKQKIQEPSSQPADVNYDEINENSISVNRSMQDILYSSDNDQDLSENEKDSDTYKNEFSSKKDKNIYNNHEARKESVETLAQLSANEGTLIHKKVTKTIIKDLEHSSDKDENVNEIHKAREKPDETSANSSNNDDDNSKNTKDFKEKYIENVIYSPEKEEHAKNNHRAKNKSAKTLPNLSNNYDLSNIKKSRQSRNKKYNNEKPDKASANLSNNDDDIAEDTKYYKEKYSENIIDSSEKEESLDKDYEAKKKSAKTLPSLLNNDDDLRHVKKSRQGKNKNLANLSNEKPDEASANSSKNDDDIAEDTKDYKEKYMENVIYSSEKEEPVNKNREAKKKSSKSLLNLSDTDDLNNIKKSRQSKNKKVANLSNKEAVANEKNIATENANPTAYSSEKDGDDTEYDNDNETQEKGVGLSIAK